MFHLEETSGDVGQFRCDGDGRVVDDIVVVGEGYQIADDDQNGDEEQRQ